LGGWKKKKKGGTKHSRESKKREHLRGRQNLEAHKGGRLIKKSTYGPGGMKKSHGRRGGNDLRLDHKPKRGRNIRGVQK